MKTGDMKFFTWIGWKKARWRKITGATEEEKVACLKY